MGESLAPATIQIPTRVYSHPKHIGENFFSSKGEEKDAIYPIKAGKIVNLPAFNYLLYEVLIFIFTRFFFFFSLIRIINHHFFKYRKLIYRAVINSLPRLNPPPLTAILLLTSHQWSRLQIEHITQYIFETLNVPAFATIPTSLCASFAYAVQSAIVIDIGKDKTEITPIVEFAPVGVSQRTIPYGSSSINSQLKKKLPKLTDIQIEALKRSDIYQVLSEEATKSSWFGINDPHGISKPSAKNDEEEGVVDVAAIVTSGRTREILAQREREKQQAIDDEKAGVVKEKEKPNEDREFNYFQSPDLPADSPSIKIGRERFQGTELLTDKISDAVGDVLKHLDEANKRQDCWDNVIIVGRGSNIKGLKEEIFFSLQTKYLISRPTMGSELPSMFNTSGYNTPSNNGPGTPNPYGGTPSTPLPSNSGSSSQHPGHGQVPTQIRFAKQLEYFIDWKNYGWEEAPFLGAEIAAKQIFGGAVEGTFITRTDYNAVGPSAIWDI